MINNVLILSRLEKSVPVDILKKKFSDFSVTVLSQESIDILDETHLEKYHRYKNICSPHIPIINAWSLALDYAISNSQGGDGQRWWFIEDDVALTPEFDLISYDLFNSFNDIAFMAMYFRTKNNMLDWPHWSRSEMILDDNDSYFSFNCFSMMTSDLISKIDDFIKEKNACLFHEILFNSVASINNFKTLDLSESNFKDYFADFRYRPEVDSGFGVLHPVKNEAVYSKLSFGDLQ